MTDLAQALRDLLVKHDLRRIQIEVTSYSGHVSAGVFWDDANSPHGCGLVHGHHTTDAALALADGIEKANAARSAAPVVELPEIEVAA